LEEEIYQLEKKNHCMDGEYIKKPKKIGISNVNPKYTRMVMQ